MFLKLYFYSPGCLLLDEMALDEDVKYDASKCEVQGMVNLGQFNDQLSEKEKNKRGNHALVIMFQPFRGKWVQTIGAFLSAGAVKGKLLHKITLESIALLEKSGYYVDVVTTDAATWNRSMWNAFGVGFGQNSCEHPIDATRRLMFASDFPHLVKGLWTRVLNKKILNVSVINECQYFQQI